MGGAQCPLSAHVVLGVIMVQQLNMCEGEVASFALALALPLAVHIDLCHLHHVAHLQEEKDSSNRQTGVMLIRARYGKHFKTLFNGTQKCALLTGQVQGDAPRFSPFGAQ